MRRVEIPINGVFRNVDGVVLSDELYSLIDGFIDVLGGVNRRPALSALYDFGQGSAKIDGLWWWSNIPCLMAVTNGRVFKVARTGTTLSVTDLTSDPLLVGNRVSFTTDGAYCFMANGGRIVYTDGTAATAYIADAQAPTTVTHVDWIDGYLIANSGGDEFQFSNVNNSLAWDASDFASAVRNTDGVTYLKVVQREVLLIGQRSVESWQNDGESPFSPSAGGYIDVGTIAPNSVVVTERGIYWLSSERRFVKFDGRGVSRVSTPYDKVFDELPSVSDCLADYLEITGHEFIVLSFPTAMRTIVFNLTTDKWSEWGAWDTANAEYDHFLMNAYAYCPDWGLHVVGLRTGSVIADLSPDYPSDPSNPIRLAIRTGHLDFGTNAKKRGGKMEMRLKRGVGLSTGTPVMTVRYRDNNNPEWSSEKQVDLGDLGETQIIKQVFMRGIFKTRQFEFVASDNVPVILARPDYHIEVLS